MGATAILAVGLAVGSSICFAGNRAFASRPLIKSDAGIITYVSLLVGLAIAGAALLISDERSALVLASALVVVVFALVGIFHYGVGRRLSYVAVKNIGANSTSPLISSNVLYSLIFSVLFLHEKMTVAIGVGTALILSGVLILEIRSSALKRGGKYRTGYLAGITAAAIFGFTPVLISFGLSIFHYYLAAIFIAYASAAIVYTLTLNSPKMIREIIKTPRAVLLLYLISSIFASGAQIFRFAALSFAPVVLIAPILSTNPIFTIILTRAVAKEVEVFTPRTILSIIIVIIGSAVVTIFA